MTRLMLGDCLERMVEIADGSVDLVLADLPFGTTQCSWDSIIPLEPLWSEYRRIIKPGSAIVLTASQPFTAKLVMSNINWFRYEWIWRKNMPTGFLDANRKPLKGHESILVFSERRAPYEPQGVERRRRRRRRDSHTEVYGKFGSEWIETGQGFPRSVLDFACSRRCGHPNAKPIPLLEYLIKTYTQADAEVLDNTMGSGSTGVACLNTGRRFIGIERDPGYFALAERRIAEASGAKASVA